MAMINPYNRYCIHLVILGPTIISAILILVDSVHFFLFDPEKSLCKDDLN